MKWYRKKTPFNKTIHTSENGRWVIRRLKTGLGWNLVDKTKKGSAALTPFDTLAEAKAVAEAREKRQAKI